MSNGENDKFHSKVKPQLSLDEPEKSRAEREMQTEGIALEFIFIQVIFEMPRAPQNTWGASIR